MLVVSEGQTGKGVSFQGVQGVEMGDPRLVGEDGRHIWQKRREERKSVEEQGRFRIRGEEACKRPSNAAVRDLLGTEMYTEAVLEFLGSTAAGTIKEGMALT